MKIWSQNNIGKRLLAMVLVLSLVVINLPTQSFATKQDDMDKLVLAIGVKPISAQDEWGIMPIPIEPSKEDEIYMISPNGDISAENEYIADISIVNDKPAMRFMQFALNAVQESAGEPTMGTTSGYYKCIYANGTPVTIKEDGQATKIYKNSDLNNPLFNEDLSVNNNYIIYGGWETDDYIGDTSITFESGECQGIIFGGSQNGDITGNTNVTVKENAAQRGNIYGGGDLGDVSGTATIKINNASIGHIVFGGGRNNGADVGTTSIEIKGSTLSDTVYGGGFGGDVLGNTSVLIEDSTIGIEVYGGGVKGEVTGNTFVSINNSSVEYNVFGGGSTTEDGESANIGGSTKVEITDNSVIGFNDGEYNHGGVYGGGINVSVEEGTSVSIKNSQVFAAVWGGGLGTVATTIKNTNIEIENGSYGWIYGGGNGIGSKINGETKMNIKNAAVTGTVFGGNDSEGTTVGSTSIEIDGGTYSWVYGGGYKGTVLGKSSLTIKNGTFINNVFGGSCEYPATIGSTEVIIENGTFSGSVFGGGDYYVHTSTGGTTSVSIEGGEFSGSVYGGGNNTSYVYGDTNVTISSGTFTRNDGYGNVYGGGDRGLVIGTTNILIEDGTFTASIHGGGVYGAVNNANVTVSGGTFNSSIYGGGYWADVTGNTSVVVDGGIINYYVYGGGKGFSVDNSYVAYRADVGGSTNVMITGGKINGVFGGGLYCNIGGSVDVDLNGGEISENVYGAGWYSSANVVENTEITLDGAEVGGFIVGGGIESGVGGKSTITASSGKADGGIFGGSAISSGMAGTVGSTEIIINDGEYGFIYGGGQYGEVTNSTYIEINGGTVTNNMFGGGLYADIGGNATINVNNGELASVYGGGAAGSVNGNAIVNIYPEPTITGLITHESGLSGAVGIGSKVDYWHKVIYNENGGTGTPPTEDGTNNGYVAAGTDAFTSASADNLTPPSGYEFENWKTSLDDTGTSYAESVGVTISNPTTHPYEDFVLYAIWKDKTAPTGEIGIKTNSWTQMWNVVTFGLFFKNTIDVTISAEDNSGEEVTIEYYLSAIQLTEEEVEEIEEWELYNDGFCVNSKNKYIVYARLTDVSNNIMIINSDGIIVYEDSEQDTVSIRFTKASTSDVTANVTLNGNTIAKINDGTKDLTPTTHYTVSGDAITFKASYLDSLVVGNYTLTIHYNPLDEIYVSDTDNDEPATTNIALTVGSVAQSALSITGKPDTVTYGDNGFTLSTNGGDGNGTVTFFIPTDDVLTIDANTGAVTIVSAGIVEVTATKAADGTYSEATATLSITVAGRNISNVNVSIIGSTAYTSSQLQPTINVTDTKTITSSDYSISYGENVNAGMNGGSITLTGTGNYTGTKTVNFTISKIAYTGIKTVSKDVYSNTATSNVNVTLPSLPDGAEYGSPSLITTNGLVMGTIGQNSGVLTFDAAAKENNVSDTITIPVTDATNYNDYNVTVTVTAKDQPKELIPNVSIDFVNERLKDFVSGAIYKIEGVEYTANNGYVAIIPAWIGTTVNIVKKGSGTNIDSDSQNLVIPARPTAPAPNKTDTTGGNINGTITNVDNTMEYKLNSQSIWTAISGTSVSGLSAGTYNVRVKSTVTTFASESVNLVVASSNVGNGSNNGGSNSSGNNDSGNSSSNEQEVLSASIIIDGKETNAGTVTTNDNITTVKLGQDEFNKKIESAKESVIIAVPSNTGTAEASLVVKNVEDMAKKDMTLTVQFANIEYTIPASAVDTKSLMEQLGTSDTSKVPVTISISTVTDSVAKTKINNTVKSSGGELIVPAINFNIVAAYNGKQVEVTTLNSYVARTVEVTAVQAGKITTAVVVEADGTIRHVPTRVYYRDGKWYAEINSRTNSTYALINSKKTYTDIKGKWYENAVNELTNKKIITDKAKKFKGDANITRGEFIEILIKALGLPANGNGSVFKDLKKSSAYYGAIGTAYEYGIVTGRNNGTYEPDVNITWQEGMTMMKNAAEVIGYQCTSGSITSYPDASSVSAWAKKAVKLYVGSGFYVHEGKLKPKKSITRGQAATSILELLQKTGIINDIITVTIEKKELNKQLKSTKGVSILINTNADIVIAQLTVSDINEIWAKNKNLTIESGNISYTIPSSAINTKAIMTQFDTDKPAEVIINIAMVKNVDDVIKNMVEKLVKSFAGKITIPVFQFTISAEYNGKMFEISKLNGYADCTVEITKKQAQNITTAIIIETDNTVRHIPTRVYKKGSKWYVTIKNCANSTYALIYNNKTNMDVTRKEFIK